MCIRDSYTIWVSQSFGAFWGFQEGYWSWISGVVDNATYPAFAMDYFNQLMNEENTDEEDDYSFSAYAAKAGIVTVLTLLNVAGLRCVDRMLIVITICSLMPFIVFMAFSAGHLDFSNCLSVRKPITINVLYKLCKLLFWNFNGFDGVSTFAGEVDNPKKSYTRGLAVALVFMSLTYFLPLLFATALNPAATPWESWDYAAFPDIFKSTPGLGPWLAYWLFGGAMLAQFGQFMTELLIDSYQLHGMALQGLVPAVFATRAPARTVLGVVIFDTPVVAIFASWIIMMGLVTRDFDEILDVDNVLTCLALLLELIAAVHLRFQMPDLHRPFKVPGTKWHFLFLSSLPFMMSLMLVGITLYEDYHKEATALYSVVVLVAVGACGPFITNLAKTRGWWTFLEWHPDCWHEVDTPKSKAVSPHAQSGGGSVLGALMSDNDGRGLSPLKEALNEPLCPAPHEEDSDSCDQVNVR
eukprot:TRINITY_DN27066_c0_g1_i2.p1 TRINITY_DN27066_c0_g1~~TRINITY_DN27066_c0_g1_i2.p1  ORF type:complete len:468 (+),score=101.93 TRINITY_DN27066_c0_g1_i2:92-1495(+)